MVSLEPHGFVGVLGGRHVPVFTFLNMVVVASFRESDGGGDKQVFPARQVSGVRLRLRNGLNGRKAVAAMKGRYQRVS